MISLGRQLGFGYLERGVRGLRILGGGLGPGGRGRGRGSRVKWGCWFVIVIMSGVG